MKKRYIYLTILISISLLISGCTKQRNEKKRNSTNILKIQKNKKKPDKVQKILNAMSLDEKIGQLYFIHSNGNFSQTKNEINKYQLGGIALFGPDFKDRTKEKFHKEIKDYQKNSQHGLFIGTDQEGGTVSRLNTNPQITDRSFPSPQEIYQKSGIAGIKKENSEVAKLLHKNGINVNFAPVADVAKNSNSFIYQRTLGKSYQETANYIPIAVKAIQSQNVAATLKHFPGYGDAGDTHTGFAQINKPFNKYEENDLLPFRAGIKAKVDNIMISHIIIKNLDAQYPASLSPLVHQFLRKKMHYTGLIMTDDLEMGAITQFAQKHSLNADVLALQAGNDILLGGNPSTGIPAIKKAIHNKQISMKQVNHSVYRILKLKQKLHILK
ncbi:glycoside hydrolase family 3 N-terminal domain-containing protein [Lactobacillus hamsteri]|uniref:beta-N-acetylhexosaminidase n=1 Tax=Lactobacillus hamsteri DSM 5661 = JCM 6256 TaxID=1423754 RepID=A0A0R1YEC7_9LACO|nr:glycoside hydrolase family 3 N-terminal domain-containing protein [Lactobacillus hamsteri]KRM40830.1 beta-N-acetylhexosaminidase [Lactobacillus hamsteri DSM 5661 = JCM 6256]